MIEKDIYDKICDEFKGKYKSPSGRSLKETTCTKSKYVLMVYPPEVPDDRQGSYSFQCNDKAKMCTITGDMYVLMEKTDSTIRKLKSAGCDIPRAKQPHITADRLYFQCAGKSYKDALDIAKILKDY